MKSAVAVPPKGEKIAIVRTAGKQAEFELVRTYMVALDTGMKGVYVTDRDLDRPWEALAKEYNLTCLKEDRR